MKTIPIKCLFIFLMILRVTYSYGQCSKEDIARLKKVAYVVGISKYSLVDPLPNPTNDALDMYNVLLRLKFDVKIDTNVDFKMLKSNIENWISSLSKCDIAIFYFAGHGAQIDGENYIFPTNGNSNSNATLRNTTYPVSELLSRMKIANSNLNLVILDACRDNPIRSTRHSIFRNGLAPMNVSGRGTLICFPTEAGKTTPDGTGRRNSIYTEAILENIVKPNTPILRIFEKVHDDVYNNTNNAQAPCIYESLGTQYDYCLKFQDYNDGKNTSANFNDTIYSENIKKFREYTNTPIDKKLHVAKKTFDNIFDSIRHNIAVISTSLGSDFTPEQGGYETNYADYTFSFPAGIQSTFFQEKKIMPTFHGKIINNDVIISITTYDNPKVYKFENENILKHETTIVEPLYDINWTEINKLTTNFFISRLDVLK